MRSRKTGLVLQDEVLERSTRLAISGARPPLSARGGGTATSAIRRGLCILRLMRFIVSFLAIAEMLTASDPCPIPTARPEEVGLKPESVNALLDSERKGGTIGITIFKDGKQIARFGEDKSV